MELDVCWSMASKLVCRCFCEGGLERGRAWCWKSEHGRCCWFDRLTCVSDWFHEVASLRAILLAVFC